MERGSEGTAAARLEAIGRRWRPIASSLDNDFWKAFTGAAPYGASAGDERASTRGCAGPRMGGALPHE